MCSTKDSSGQNDVAVADFLNLEEEVDIIHQGVQQISNIPAHPEDDFFTGWLPPVAVNGSVHSRQHNHGGNIGLLNDNPLKNCKKVFCLNSFLGTKKFYVKLKYLKKGIAAHCQARRGKVFSWGCGLSVLVQ